MQRRELVVCRDRSAHRSRGCCFGIPDRSGPHRAQRRRPRRGGCSHPLGVWRPRARSRRAVRLWAALLREITDELAAADPAISAARAAGASDAELTPLYERFHGLRHHIVLDLADESEAAEMEDLAALRTTPLEPSSADEMVDEMMLESSHRDEMLERMEVPTEEGGAR